MKRYTHDYTKAAAANENIHFALLDIRLGDMNTARRHILIARQLMDEYLASDNMVPDEDIEFGWYRAEEVEENM